jgi:hypothetical protein
MVTHTPKEIAMTGEMLELFIDEGARPRRKDGDPAFDGDTMGAEFGGTVNEAVRAIAAVGIEIGLLLASGNPTAMGLGEQLQIQAEQLKLQPVALVMVVS